MNGKQLLINFIIIFIIIIIGLFFYFYFYFRKSKGSNKTEVSEKRRIQVREFVESTYNQLTKLAHKSSGLPSRYVTEESSRLKDICYEPLFCVSFCLSVCLSVPLSFCLSVFLSFCLSVFLGLPFSPLPFQREA